MNTQELIENFSYLDNWEDKYRYIIELGTNLAPFADADKTQDNIVEGCQSQVWLKKTDNNTYIADSDAMIVKGLLFIALTILNEDKNANIDDAFSQIGLLEHLSPSRRNGLFAVVETIKNS